MPSLKPHKYHKMQKRKGLMRNAKLKILVIVQQERLNEEEKQKIIYGKTRKLTQFHSVLDVNVAQHFS